MGRPVILDDMEIELKCRFGKTFKVRDIVKYINNGTCKVVTTLVFAALACAVILGVFQGSITTAIASSIIAVIGVCYLIYLNLDNIYEGFKKKLKESLLKKSKSHLKVTHQKMIHNTITLFKT